MSFWKVDHLVGGLSGGFISTMVVHPLDLLKIRFAANEGAKGSPLPGAVARPQHGGYVSTARAIVRSAGLGGLYQGLAPNLLGNTLAWGLYFHLFNTFKGLLRSSGQEGPLGAHLNLLAGLMSGVGTITLTNPIWVAKTRLCLQYEGHAGQRYRGLLHVLAHILRTDGLRGWYKGYLPGLVGTSHGAIQFMVYEELRKAHHGLTGRDMGAKLGAAEYVVMASVAKLCAVSATYPYQVVRTRLQDQHVAYSGAGEVVRVTWAREGLRGFYKGLLPSMWRVLPATAITFLVYENVSHAVRQRQSSEI